MVDQRGRPVRVKELGSKAPMEPTIPVFVSSKNIADAKKRLDALLDKSDTAGTSYQYGVRFKQPKSEYFVARDGRPEIMPGNSLVLKNIDEANAVIKTLSEIQNEASRMGIPGIRNLRGGSKLDSNGSMGDGVMALRTGRALNSTPLDPNAPLVSASGSLIGQHPVTATMWHEFGHDIHQQMGRFTKSGAPALESEIGTLMSRLSSSGHTIVYPTQGSMRNSVEYFAETYAMIKTGRESLVDPKILEWMKGKGIV